MIRGDGGGGVATPAREIEGAEIDWRRAARWADAQPAKLAATTRDGIVGLRSRIGASMARSLAGVVGTYSTILADPPWRFMNRTGKMAPEHRRLRRYETMRTADICALPVSSHAATNAHLYLWVPNALLADGLAVMKAWGFQYKSNLVWYKTRKDGGPDGRGVGFYFRNVTELVLFGIRGHLRTLKPGRTQVNLVPTRKEEHSKKPDEFYDLIEACSPGPYLELFARFQRAGWTQWGNEIGEYEARRPERRGYTRPATDPPAQLYDALTAVTE